MDRLPSNINLSPHLITHPVALAALGVIAVILLVVAGAPWYAYGLVILILVAVFFALIKWPHLRMEGEHLYNATRDGFETFDADATQHSAPQPTEPSELDALRVEEYEKNRGLFLAHRWRPSEDPSQVADVIIRVRGHLDTSTRESVLRTGKVESVR